MLVGRHTAAIDALNTTNTSSHHRTPWSAVREIMPAMSRRQQLIQNVDVTCTMMGASV